jgi:hypothetical protein
MVSNDQSDGEGAKKEPAFPETKRPQPEVLPPESAVKESPPLVKHPETGVVERLQTLEETIGLPKKETIAKEISETPTPARPTDKSSEVPYVSAAVLQQLKGMSRAEQVEYLTEIVFQEGLEKAITLVKRLNDAYLLDLLHDTLVAKLYQKLKGPALKERPK